MKKLFLFLLALGFVGFIQAQSCMPNDTVTTLVHPVPMNSANPDGGINKIACKGQPYEFLFTVNVPELFNYTGIDVPLDSAIMSTSDAIINLPLGLDYFCNPNTCTFLPNTAGCALVSGTVDNSVAAGNYNLDLDFVAYVKVFGQSLAAPYQYPGDTTLTEDRYTLKVMEANSAACTVGLFDAPIEAGSMRIAPNPVNDVAFVLAELITGGSYRVEVYNSVGAVVSNYNQTMSRGDNLLELEVADWPAGMYWLRLSNENKQVKKAFVVSH